MTFSNKNQERKMNTSNFAIKSIKFLALAILFIGIASCSDDDDKPLLEVESGAVGGNVTTPRGASTSGGQEKN
jgi:hypothetical protein